MTDATFEDQLFGKKVIDNRNVLVIHAIAENIVKFLDVGYKIKS